MGIGFALSDARSAEVNFSCYIFILSLLMQQLPPIEQAGFPLSSILQQSPIFLHESPQQAIDELVCIAPL